MALSANDVRRVLDFVGEAYDAGDLDELRRFLPVGLSELIRTDYASYNEVGSDGVVYATVSHPEVDPSMHDEWARYAHQNPLMGFYARTRDGRAYRFSDVAEQHELDRLELFSEFYRLLGVRHQIAFTLPSPPQLTFGLALSRGGRDYSDRDRDVLNLTRPHLIQAYRNVQARERAAHLIEALRRGVDAGGEAIAIVEAGELSFVSQAARSFLYALGWTDDAASTARARSDWPPVGSAADPRRRREHDRPPAAERQPRQLRDRLRASAHGADGPRPAQPRAEPA